MCEIAPEVMDNSAFFVTADALTSTEMQSPATPRPVGLLGSLPSVKHTKAVSEDKLFATTLSVNLVACRGIQLVSETVRLSPEMESMLQPP